MTEDLREMETAPQSAVPQPDVGEQLKKAREAARMSVGDIAMALKLGPRQVEALEQGDWQRLPGQTFIRGFVRNYARLVQIDATPLMAQLDSVLVTPQQHFSLPGEVQATAMPQTQRSPKRLILGLSAAMVVIATIGGGVALMSAIDIEALRASISAMIPAAERKEAPPAAVDPVFPPGQTPQQVMNPQAVTPPENATPATPPQEAPAPAAPAPLAPPPLQPAPAPAAPAPQSAAPLAEPAAKPASATVGAADLRFTFVQDSWVEVRDRNGKIILSHSGKTGSEQSVSGVAPFALVVGNAHGVKLLARGAAVDLSKHTNGRVARLTVE